MPDRRELQRLSGAPEGTPETSLLRKETAKRLREAVQSFPRNTALILILHDMEDLSDADVAEITGLRQGTIRVRLHRARLFVRKELAQQEQRRVRRRMTKPIPAIASPRAAASKALPGNVRRTLQLS